MDSSIDFNLIFTCEVGEERDPLQMKKFLRKERDGIFICKRQTVSIDTFLIVD